MTVMLAGRGRPLRFLVLVLGAWIGMRTWQLWPAATGPATIRDAARRLVATAAPPTVAGLARIVPAIAGGSAARGKAAGSRTARRHRAQVAMAPGGDRSFDAPPALPAAAAMVAATPVEATSSYVLGLLGMVRYGPPAPLPPPRARRWSASGWAIVRGSGPGGGVATPQLGGGQAGVRIVRSLDARGTVAIAGRVAAALATRQREAAVGVEWRPAAVPVRIVAERRIGLAGVRGGTALGLVGGIGALALPAGFRLDGYGQAGAVARDRVEAYADGALRIARPVAGGDGGTVLSLGLGAWGAAQRGAQRLDIGPSATLEVPVGDASRLRIALEWRQRVAGAARPGSGPALSIGTDY